MAFADAMTQWRCLFSQMMFFLQQTCCKKVQQKRSGRGFECQQSYSHRHEHATMSGQHGMKLMSSLSASSALLPLEQPSSQQEPLTLLGNMVCIHSETTHGVKS